MPMPIERQSDQYANSPHIEQSPPGATPASAPRLEDLPDSAYGGGPGDPLFGEFGHDGYDYEGVSRGEFNHRTRDYDPEAASQAAREHQLGQDEETGYNWGPPPSEHHLQEHQVHPHHEEDPFPYE